MDYQKIFKKYKIICNNSVNRGDCYGDSYCHNCNHEDRQCVNCVIVICGCCLNLHYDNICPACNNKIKSKYVFIPNTPDEWYKHNLVCFDKKKINKKGYSKQLCNCKF